VPESLFSFQETHKAITDVEIMTMRLGKMGEFETVDNAISGV
jgi:hypothetical protein